MSYRSLQLNVFKGKNSFITLCDLWLRIRSITLPLHGTKIGSNLQLFLENFSSIFYKIYTVFFLYFLYYFLFGCALREFFATRLVEFDWKCKDRLKASANCQSRSTVYIILNIYTNRASIYI